jgi:hypothetical protein
VQAVEVGFASCFLQPNSTLSWLGLLFGNTAHQIELTWTASDSMQTLLSIPTVSGMAEDEFVAECAGQDGLVTDPAFEPGVASL